jgi:hypothetical protein
MNHALCHPMILLQPTGLSVERLLPLRIDSNAKLQLRASTFSRFHKSFAEVDNGVMIGMLLGDDARKAAGPTFGLENELVA